jgi:hypothetical protein
MNASFGQYGEMNNVGFSDDKRFIKILQNIVFIRKRYKLWLMLE